MRTIGGVQGLLEGVDPPPRPSSAPSAGILFSSIHPGSFPSAHRLPPVVPAGPSLNHQHNSFLQSRTHSKKEVYTHCLCFLASHSLPNPFPGASGFLTLYANCSQSQQRPPPHLSLNLSGKISPITPQASREPLARAFRTHGIYLPTS